MAVGERMVMPRAVHGTTTPHRGKTHEIIWFWHLISLILTKPGWYFNTVFILWKFSENVKSKKNSKKICSKYSCVDIWKMKTGHFPSSNKLSLVGLAASGGMAVIAGVFKLVIIMDQTGIQTTLWASRTPTLPQHCRDQWHHTGTRSKYQQAALCRYCKANLVKKFGLSVVYYGQSTIVLLPLCVYAGARV